jgi:Glycoside hydrolase family 5 C-terminal domain
MTASSFYDEESGVFVIDFSCDMSVNAPTVIYLNEREHYPNGYKASIEFDLEDHKIRAKVDQTERNYYKVELHQIEKNAVFKTTMASIVITKDLLEKSGMK